MTTDGRDSAGAGGAEGAEGAEGAGPGREEDLAAASRFTEQFAAQLVWAGMPRMPARVFAALLASDAGALTAAELGERLRVSPAAVSGAVRYLTQQYMVTRERAPGSRRDLFRVHSNQWYEALTNRDSVLQRWETALRDGMASLGPHSPAGRRLEETLAFFEFIEKELAGMMSRWRTERASRFGPPT
ncbi:MarR family transcriptional regulator [Streptomyces sp. CC224B]|uniref:GbsR/MarR family transcriptional regulator n=1 Tax=Streptomyces sp. CC224B TaxID=3044571 RepID=UPI0024A7B37B|nr:MarR family transcriptional regulator [Streptomyces sp. CC224B]